MLYIFKKVEDIASTYKFNVLKRHLTKKRIPNLKCNSAGIGLKCVLVF